MNPHLKAVLQMTALAAASALAFWLLTAHWGHVLGLLPFALFFTCPLMHLFMHHGHGHGRDHHDSHPTQPPGG
jgi:hypothetical protein